jgi:RNA polymerase sigma-70 factor (ECF subfamily)
MSEPPRSSFARASAGEPVLDLLLADNLPRLQAFVRAHMAPELRRRESVHDLVQSVCRTLLAERERFDFRSEAEFRAWLFTSALNKIRQKHRFHHQGQRDVRREQDRPDGASELGALAAGYSGIARPSELAAARERIEALEAALDTLEPDHREVIALARLADLPTREAAAVMGRSEAATRMLLGRALTRLAAALRRAGIEP